MPKIVNMFAQALDAIARIESGASAPLMGKAEALGLHRARLAMLQAHMPHGSALDQEASTPQRLVFAADFHHMDESGGYAGWSSHTVVVTPCLKYGFALRVTGRDRDGIKDYIGESFHHALTQPFVEA